MLYKAFLDELSKTKGWRTEDDGAIRNQSGACTICHLANRRLKKRKFADTENDVAQAAKVLGLKQGIVDKIVVATDNDAKDSHFSERTRRDILKAIGLS